MLFPIEKNCYSQSDLLSIYSPEIVRLTMHFLREKNALYPFKGMRYLTIRAI